MAKSTKEEIVDAAKTASDGVRSLAGEALGAAAAAAAGVVMGGVAKALMSGQEQVTDATPAATKVLSDKVSKAVAPKRVKKRAAKKKVVKKKAVKKVVAKATKKFKKKRI